MNDALRRWAELEASKRELEAALKQIEDERKALEERALEAMVEDGIEKFSVNGLTFYVEQKLLANVRTLQGETTDATHARVAAALDAVGWGAAAGMRVNASTLSALCREAEKSGEEIPAALADHIYVDHKFSLRARAR